MRYYLTGNGRKLVSVTTFLSATESGFLQKKLAAAKDRINQEQGEDAWDSRTKASQARGNFIHRYAENHLSGLPQPEVPDEYRHYVNALEFYLIDRPFDRVLLTESKVKSESIGYAGRIDLLVLRDRSIHLIDFKTFGGYQNVFTGEDVRQWQVFPKGIESSWKDIKSRAKKALTQLGCYKIALEEMGYCSNVSCATVVVLCSDSTYQEIHLRPRDWRPCVAAIKKRMAKFREIEAELLARNQVELVE